MESEIRKACETGDLATIKRYGTRWKNIDDKKMAEYFGNASFHGHMEVVKYFLESEFDVNSKSVHGITAITNDFKRDSPDMVRLLLAYGADIDYRPDPYTCTYADSALGDACRRGHPQIVEVLLENSADANLPDELGETPLQIAKNCGFTEIVKMIEEHLENQHDKKRAKGGS